MSKTGTEVIEQANRRKQQLIEAIDGCIIDAEFSFDSSTDMDDMIESMADVISRMKCAAALAREVL